MAELKVILRRISEDGFVKNEEILSDTSKPLYPQMGFDLMSDIKKNLLTIATQVGFITPEKTVGAHLRFHFTLEVINLSDLEYVSNPEKGTHDYKFPKGFLEAILTDVYATARIMLAQKLVGTRLEGIYLPFGGANELIKLTKKH